MFSIFDLHILTFALIAFVIPALVLLILRRVDRWRSVANGLLITLAVVFLLLSAGEMYFRYVQATTDGGFPLATQNWIDRYWQQNSLGFRDREWIPTDWQGRKTVLVIGDSFAAGWGIANPDDRFSDMLVRLLGDDCDVINAAQIGANTPDQLEILQSYPLKNPDVVILQYYLNDIEPAAAQVFGEWHWLNQPTPPLAAESAVMNFFYQRTLPNTNVVDPETGLNYSEWLYAAYADPTAWGIHHAELEALIDYAELRGVRLMTVLFPHLLEPETGATALDQVAGVFAVRGYAENLRLDELADWSIGDRVVSAVDAHPSVAVHEYVGRNLYDQFFGADFCTMGS